MDSLSAIIFSAAPSLLTSGVVGIAGLLVYNSRQLVGIRESLAVIRAEVETTESRITKLEEEISTIKNSYFSKTEMLETLKRIELYFEVILLKSGNKESKTDIDLTSGFSK